jgi:hypothetical protein
MEEIVDELDIPDTYYFGGSKFDIETIRCLDLEDVSNLTRQHPQVALPYSSVFLPAAISTVKMTIQENIAERRIETIRQAYHDGRLALFIGAGVSKSTGLPNWTELMQRISAQLIQRYSTDGLTKRDQRWVKRYFQAEAPASPIILARLLRDSLGADFTSYVQEALYDKTDPHSTSPIVEQLGDLCRPIGSIFPVRGVVNYNFDDTLELALQRLNIPYGVIASEDDGITDNELAIYHVHGFLPRKSSTRHVPSRQLVLTEDTYHQHFVDPYNWSNLIQLNLLRYSVCLFVGLSVEDPNLRRLLEIAREKKSGSRHFAIIRDHWVTPKIGKQPAEVQALPAVFRVLEEASLSKLGISTVWVSKYGEVADVLAAILR